MLSFCFKIIGVGDKITMKLRAIFLHSERDGIHHFMAKCHIMILSIPQKVSVLVIKPDDEAVLQRIHSHAMHIIYVKPATRFVVMAPYTLSKVICLLLLREFYVLFKLPTDECAGKNADKTHG